MFARGDRVFCGLVTRISEGRSASSTAVKPAQLKTQGAPPKVSAGQPYTNPWTYYKVQWGHQQEFLQLFLKNHYPVLEKVQGTGRILALKIETPAYHTTGDRAMGLSGDDPLQGLDGGDDGEPRRRKIKKELWPGPGDVCERGAAERFEILLAH